MKKNTHLSPTAGEYLDAAALGESLYEDLEEAARTALGLEDDVELEVNAFRETHGEGGDEEFSFGYEILVAGQHKRVDDGFSTALDALEAAVIWCERRERSRQGGGAATDEDDDEQDDEDDEDDDA